jgi:hypothetical protein
LLLRRNNLGLRSNGRARPSYNKNRFCEGDIGEVDFIIGLVVSHKPTTL